MTVNQLDQLDRLLDLATEAATIAGLPHVIVWRIEGVQDVLPQLRTISRSEP